MVEPLRDQLDRVEGQLAGARPRAGAGRPPSCASRWRPWRPARRGSGARPPRWSTRCAGRRRAAAGVSCTCAGCASTPGCSTAATSRSSRRCRARGGLLRPDLVVRLPGGRSVVVDAKVTLAAYLEAVEADDDARARGAHAAHARHLRHARRPAGRQGVLAAVPRHAPSSSCCSCRGRRSSRPRWRPTRGCSSTPSPRRVHLATPTTLLSLLRTVAYAWQQDALAEDAAGGAAAGRELFDRLSTFGGHVDKLGRGLGRTVGDFNAAVGSPRAHRAAAGAAAQRARAHRVRCRRPAPVEEVVRPLSVAAPGGRRGTGGRADRLTQRRVGAYRVGARGGASRGTLDVPGGCPVRAGEQEARCRAGPRSASRWPSC